MITTSILLRRSPRRGRISSHFAHLDRDYVPPGLHSRRRRRRGDVVAQVLLVTQAINEHDFSPHAASSPPRALTPWSRRRRRHLDTQRTVGFWVKSLPF